MVSILSKYSSILLVVVFNLFSMVVHAENVMSLESAILRALQNDPWLHQNKLKQSALEFKSMSSGSMPDPMISMGLLNMPTDTFNTHQENMTKYNVGISQVFPRGNSLEIKRNQLKVESTKFPLLREVRKATIQRKVSQLWLDAFLAQETISLIENNRVLFEQIADVAHANYSSVIGKISQHDVIRAQLEIVQLEDRLTVEYQNLETSISQLDEWLYSYHKQTDDNFNNFDASEHSFRVSNTLPDVVLLNKIIINKPFISKNKLAQLLVNHPSVLAIDAMHKASKENIKLVQQQYKPQWGLNANYSHREDMRNGDDRANLLSVAVTFDLPIFTQNKQDKNLAASIAVAESVKTEKYLLIRKMISAVTTEYSTLNRLLERQTRYNETLIRQIHDQAEASLTAYTNDDGNFSEVVSARIAELNTQILALQIDVDVLKTKARLNYYFKKSKSNNSSALLKNVKVK